MNPEPALKLTDVSMAFGGNAAVRNMSMEVPQGEIRGLIGPNGAGKTTLINCITGLYRATAGRIRINGVEVVGTLPWNIARLGVRRTFQTPQLITAWTVRQNLRLGGIGGTMASMSALARVAADNPILNTRIERVLAQFELEGLGDEPVKHLPFGQLRLVEVARAFVQMPKLLILDEPTAGLSPPEVDRFCTLLRQNIESVRCAVVLIEHNMGVISRLADMVTVMNQGSEVLTDPPLTALKNRSVQEIYLEGEPGDVAG